MSGNRILLALLLLLAGFSPVCAQQAENTPKSALSVAQTFLEQPELARMEVFNLIGQTFADRRQFEHARQFIEEVVRLSEANLPDALSMLVPSLGALAEIYEQTGREAEAQGLWERQAQLSKTLVDASPSYLTSERRAALHFDRGQFDPAIERYASAVEGREAALGASHVSVGTTLVRLGRVHLAAGMLDDAERTFRRAIDVYARTASLSDLEMAHAYNGLAEMERLRGNPEAAESHYQHAMKLHDLGHIRRQVEDILGGRSRGGDLAPLVPREQELARALVPADHPASIAALIHHGLAEFNLGRPKEALDSLRSAMRHLQSREMEGTDYYAQLVPLYVLEICKSLCDASETLDIADRLLQQLEASLLPDNWLTDSYKRLSQTYASAGQTEKARKLEVRWRAQEQAKRLIDRATNEMRNGEMTSANKLYRQALALLDEVTPDRPTTANLLHWVTTTSGIYGLDFDFPPAIANVKRAIAILESKPFRDRDSGLTSAYRVLVQLYLRQKKYQEAAPYIHRSLHLALNQARGNPGYLTSWLGDLANALDNSEFKVMREELYRLSALFTLTVDKEAMGTLGLTLARVAWSYDRSGRKPEAKRLFEIALDSMEAELDPMDSRLATTLRTQALYDKDNGDFETAYRRAKQAYQITSQTLGGVALFDAEVFASIALMLARTSSDRRDALVEEAFLAQQVASLNSSSIQLTRSAARQATLKNSQHPRLRHIHEINHQIESLEQLLTARTGPAPEKPRTDLSVELSKLQQTRDALLKAFHADNPLYRGMATPEPIGSGAVRALLQPDEVIVSFVPNPVNGFVFALTRDKLTWAALGDNWKRVANKITDVRCSAALSDTACASREGSRFDLQQAHQLYQELFGPIAEQLRGKKLILVPDHVYLGFPFHLLVTKPIEPSSDERQDYKRASWLFKAHPSISILPSYANFVALRSVLAKRPRASEPYMAMANPLLLGPALSDKSASLAQRCPDQSRPRRNSATLSTRNAVPIGGVYSNGRVATEQLRRLEPLPETADEVCAVARSLGVGQNHIFLGAKATERNLKNSSEKGMLKRYRVLHFATHGALAGEISSVAEPGLVLTPPDSPSADDDGYLSASEVAGLDLNADWVILSACNTSGGDKSGGALSGLASSFFLAGARSLLVSHWPVESDAATKLTTRMFARMQANRLLSRGEALVLAMRDLLSAADSTTTTHPGYWGAFALVGEVRY